MTVLIQPSLSSPASYLDERFVVVHDPRPGTIVELAPGSQLAVTFRRGLGPSRWRVTGLPGHVVLLSAGGHAFQFLVFDCRDGAVPVRFERRHPDHEMAHEVCELLVLPVGEGSSVVVSGDDARTSTSA